MGLTEYVKERLLGPPDQTTSYVSVGNMLVRVGEDGLLHLTEAQFRKIEAEHRGVINPYVATKHSDGSYTLESNHGRENNRRINTIDS